MTGLLTGAALAELDRRDGAQVWRAGALVEKGHLAVSLEVGHLVWDARGVDGQLLVIDTNAVAVGVGV